MAAQRKTRSPADRESGPATAGETARALLGTAETTLAGAGVDTPRLDAELLLAHALGVSRPQLITGLDVAPPPSARAEFDTALARRAAREPLAYITGEKGFRRIVLRVDPAVLIPRPETELLVDVVMDVAPARVLDVATGSGAVALALADEAPSVAVTATDVSPEALAVAAGNARRLGLADRVRFLRADLLDGVDGEYDSIAANLPYVCGGEIDSLQPEIAFEPRAALDGGPDGLDLVRALVTQIAAGFTPVGDPCRILAPGGLIALEIGDDQGPATARILTDTGFEGVVVHQDLTGRDRVVAARAPQ